MQSFRLGGAGYVIGGALGSVRCRLGKVACSILSGLQDRLASVFGIVGSGAGTVANFLGGGLLAVRLNSTSYLVIGTADILGGLVGV